MEGERPVVESQVEEQKPEAPKGEKLCYICNLPGHLARACPSAPAGGNANPRKRFVAKRRAVKKCFTCGKPGHLARDCPMKESAEGNAPAETVKEEVVVATAPNAEVVEAKPAKEEKLCRICNKPGHFARNCPENTNKKRRRRPMGNICYKCLVPGHLARDCTNEIVCNRCQQPGHKLRDCKNEIVCYNCKQAGHISSQCTNDIVCYKCGGVGHKRRDCPQQE